MVGSAIAAGIGAAGNIVGGLIQGDAADDALEAQTAAAARANQINQQVYDEQKAMHAPWQQAGLSALSGMQHQDFSRDFGENDMRADPGYQFRMQEGQKALERSAAARGGLQSGGTLKALSQYSQNIASNEYQNAYTRFNQDRDRRFGRLSQLAGYGQNANDAMTKAGSIYAGRYGESLSGLARNQGDAGIAKANIWANSLSGLGKMGMEYGLMGKSRSNSQRPDWNIAPNGPMMQGGL